jgi:outer membrane protein assembly factor BamB
VKSEEMGKQFHTQLNGQTITVKVVEMEQRLGNKRGKWVCINEATGRKLWRTSRQLHPIHQQS